MTAIIDTTVQGKISKIIDEMNLVVLEREAVIHGFWVARIAQLHMVMLGPGGTAKSFLANEAQSRIADSIRFTTALDETTDPSKVFGPIDVKALAERGRSSVVTTGMLPEATDAFIDEIMNANAPVKHSLQPALNERIFHNGGQPTDIPLRSMIAGTNKNDADTDPNLAPFFDRLHIRFTVDYIAARDSQSRMVAQAIARIASAGRGSATGNVGAERTTVTLDELDQAHREALSLDVSDDVMNMFLDLREELRGNGILISDRRMVEGMSAVLANAWLRNHPEVKIGDLDILSTMWWSLQETESVARGIILAATNPTEKAAMDLLDDLDALKAEMDEANKAGMDLEHKRRLGVEQVRNSTRIANEARQYLVQAEAAGADTTRLREVQGKADAYQVLVGRELFNLNPDQLTAMQKA